MRAPATHAGDFKCTPVCVCVRVCVCVCVCVTDSQGASAATTRFSEFRFSGPTTFSLAIATLPTFLHQLSALDSPSVTLELSAYAEHMHEVQQWLEQLAQTATAAAPLRPHVGFDITMRVNITHEIVAIFQQMGAEVHGCKARRVQLQPGGCVGMEWPWERLHLHMVTSEELMRLPCPSTCRVPPVMTCPYVVLEEGVSDRHIITLCRP